jgi:hypothetical protein
MRAGRLHYSLSWFNGAEQRAKDPLFVDWAKDVFSGIRRSLWYDKELDLHLGADAARLIASGTIKVIQ